MPAYIVAALYHFAPLPDFAQRQPALLKLCKENGICGTLLLADEGVNGTIAGTRQGLDIILAELRSWAGFENLTAKFSTADEKPFFRMKVRLKKEIVTMGVPGIDGAHDKGQYVTPENWDALISAQDTILIDTRNDYEVAIGTFKGAINPKTETFREFPKWFDELAKDIDEGGPKPKIAMFCTGGIRCEKATAYVKAQGYDEVYHLQGGILKYLEEVPQEKSSYEGDCFVFDARVAVGHGLAQSDYVQCHACRMPLSPTEVQSDKYVEGISCPHCFDKRDEMRRARYEERQHQMQLAKMRGMTHLGDAEG
ncbi:hypothetical protein LPB140_02290 [Sphingorhabdus lutea]|uniref:tRNA uridine(34) hydroxylase n=2 Tax=Sphingorhabdus lutea TaxID=1913578 RepID=A0A1L3JEB3_9SPHN|nr:hypothetical protein LPB140_02290 [Sphingorhabdus lutea]